MTLILTAMTRRSVIQVADMRLTNVRTGKVEDEATAKMVAYAGRFVLSFAGPASMGREPTARWMARVLSGVQDPGEILAALRRECGTDRQAVSAEHPRSGHRRRRLVRRAGTPRADLHPAREL